MARGGAQKKEETVAVAIDKDKGSQQALKWAVDRLLSRGQALTLLHVRQKPSSAANSMTNISANSDPNDEPSAAYKQQLENQAREFFLPFRCLCTRKDIQCKEVILEETEIVKTLINYVDKNLIDILVLGAASRGGIVRRFKSTDVPTSVSKAAPDFCTVYIIAKGKVSSVRQATLSTPAKITPLRNQPQPAPSGAPPRHQLQHQTTNVSDVGVESNQLRSQPSRLTDTPESITPPSHRASHEEFEIKSPFMRPGSRASMNKAHDPFMLDSDISFVSCGRSSVDRNFPPAWNTGDSSRLSNCSEYDNFSSVSSVFGIKSIDASHDMSSCSQESDTFSWTSNSQTAQDDVEAEMRRLKLELKQTMDMYSTACKEALTAKQKANELHLWKLGEEQRYEEARLAEGVALAIAKKEKVKRKAAVEAAQAAQKIAALETRKRASAEKMADMEAEETKKALSGFGHGELGYRRYTIKEIETATCGFSEVLKIGEGGYGPVYRGELDHTQVAIKILRPDAAQGRSQFQQEVEVLSCIRHPNMVLLLGACPENGCLVYEFMANGSLEDCLFRKDGAPVLSWQLRFRIAAEIATGLLFLHQTRPEPIVHRDLKPANILLDRNYVSKISDVGLARLVPPSIANHVTQYRMTATAGTFCYIDPEYQQTGQLGIKSDVYSLGVMLLQIITSRPPIGLAHNVERAIERGKFAEMLDREVTDWPVEDALKFAKLSLQCAEMRKRDRPDLGKVVLPELNRLRTMAEESMGIPSPSCLSASSSPRASHALSSQELISPHQVYNSGLWSDSSKSQSSSSTSSHPGRPPLWMD